MPRPADPSTLKVINLTYTLLQRHLRWPRFDELDWELDRFTGLQADTELLRAEPKLFYGFSQGTTAFRDDQQIALSIAGLTACEAAAEDLRAFLDVVRRAVQIRDAVPPGDDSEARISTEDVARVLPAAGRQEMLARLGAILGVENWGWKSASNKNSASWSFSIDRRIRRLRGLVDVGDYWSRVHEPDDVAPPRLSRPSANPDQATRVRAWIELHTEPPRLVIVNASDAEIRNVVPTPTLYSRDSTGEVAAMVGGSQVGRVAELSPGGAAVMDLPQFALSSRGSGVESSLHVEFDDSRAQRWQLGHGQVIAIGPLDDAIGLAGRVMAARDLNLSEAASALTNATDLRAVFISYVHENRELVDELQTDLERAGIVVWRDLDRLFPGDNIKQKVDFVIREQSSAFISCFSSERAARETTMANRELNAAIDVLQDRTTSNWFIPLALDATPIPSINLGALHGNIHDLLRVDLFGPDRPSALARLCASLHRLT